MEVKAEPNKFSKKLEGKTLAMLFMKTSTRTRCAFEAAMTRLGGHAQFLDWNKTNFVIGDIEDEVRCLSRYADIILARVYEHEEICAIQNAATVPVINGLCRLYHPTQIIADCMTIIEKLGKLKGVKLAYVGDGNNVCHSLIDCAIKMGFELRVATPNGYEPNEEILKRGKDAGLFFTNDPNKAIKDAEVVYTDTWVSMGDEKKKEQIIKDFDGWTLTQELLDKNNAKNAIIMHCLPAHRGYEISDELMDSKNSVVFDQAENRMHAARGIILKLLEII